EAEKLAFQPGPLRLDAFCEACLQEARALVATQPGAAIDLQLQMRGCEASVVLDEALMHHILGNLLSNAIKYSPKGGTVRIDVACNRADIEISVADSGIGMSAQDLPHLFETFYRASNVGNVAGTGLGLAIVKHAVELHGGRIDVGSTPGIGTRFVVSLPRVRDTQTSPDAQP
ncbi:MAG: sensor histidine kinase, partial [Betaproteobacteria bacterium]|nr:sensor histidine kinase [Betaproteobacteria bacterium]